jgi:predicted transcriptional regulator
MKNLSVKHFDEKEEEILDALIILGLSRPVAKTLTYLRQVNEVKSRELEMGTDLRQPEISIATKQLEELGWIIEREEKKPGKGRPYKIYSLKVGFNDIIAHLEKQQRKAVDEVQGKIERLKELGKE